MVMGEGQVEILQQHRWPSTRQRETPAPAAHAARAAGARPTAEQADWGASAVSFSACTCFMPVSGLLLCLHRDDRGTGYFWLLLVGGQMWPHTIFGKPVVSGVHHVETRSSCHV